MKDTLSVLTRLKHTMILCFISLIVFSCAGSRTAQRGALLRAEKAYARGEYEEAMTHASRAENRYSSEMSQSEKASAALLKANCLSQLNRLPEAIAMYNFVVNTFPETSEAAMAGARLKELQSSEN